MKLFKLNVYEAGPLSLLYCCHSMMSSYGNSIELHQAKSEKVRLWYALVIYLDGREREKATKGKMRILGVFLFISNARKR
jgi:hypothetical protein